MKRGGKRYSLKLKDRIKKTRNKRTKRSRRTTLKFLRAHLEANNIWLRKHPVDTLTFYRTQLGFEEPSLVLIDASMFHYLASNGKTLDHIKDLIGDHTAILCTTRCVLRDLEFFSTTYSGSGYPLNQSIQLARLVKLEGCLHRKEITSDKCIRTILGIHNSQKLFLATKVNGWWPLVDNNRLIPIITVGDDGLMLKELCRSERQQVKNWCTTIPLKKPAITDTKLKASPEYQRLLNRFTFYGYDGEITVNDSESQFKAISGQLDPSKWPHEAVRGFVVDQLLLHSERYEDHFKNQSRYLAYLVSLSRDGQWGDAVTLQAAADFFGVDIVVVNSQKESFPVSQYTPYGVENPKKAICIACLSIMNEVHYNSLRWLPTAESFPSACIHNYMGPEEHRLLHSGPDD